MKFTYSDFGLLFKKHPSTQDIIVKYDVDAIRQALTVLFLTNNYEKLFDPNFGIGMRGLLFENMTSITKIALLKKIKNQVAFYEPRVVVEDIKMNNDFDSNDLRVDFYFYPVGNPSQKEILTLSFERIR
jgi:phage baseplate assembly protein W